MASHGRHGERRVSETSETHWPWVLSRRCEALPVLVFDFAPADAELALTHADPSFGIGREKMVQCPGDLKGRATIDLAHTCEREWSRMTHDVNIYQHDKIYIKLYMELRIDQLYQYMHISNNRIICNACIYIYSYLFTQLMELKETSFLINIYHIFTRCLPNDRYFHLRNGVRPRWSRNAAALAGSKGCLVLAIWAVKSFNFPWRAWTSIIHKCIYLILFVYPVSQQGKEHS